MFDRSTTTPTIDAALVRRLIAAQFPQWTGLGIKPLLPGGWDNRTFHLGEDMIVRLPSAASYALQVEKEQVFLPKLAPHLPLPIPVPVAKGVPGEGYSWPWSVYRWLRGETAADERIGDLKVFAEDLGRFLVALRHVDPSGGPLPGPHNFFRGGPPAHYDAETRRALTALEGRIDTQAAVDVWEAALSATWQGAPVWFHGDISWGNLLVEEGRLGAVIDFGTCGIGDPACDLAIAWTLFRGESREAFRAGVALDAGTWARGRGWALWKALIVYAGLPGTNAAEADKSRRVIEEVLGDHRDFG